MYNWFECKISYDKMLENGTQKKVTEPYLVDALSFTEAEARIIEEIRPYISGEFFVADIKRARISEIFFNENGDRWFKAKIYFITLDEKSGAEKKTASQMLAQASDIAEALKVVEAGMKGTLADYSIASLIETALIDVLPYDASQIKPTDKQPELFEDEKDDLFDKARQIIIEKNIASTSVLQRTLQVGYNRANKIMNDLEKAGIVGPFKGASPRDILTPNSN